MYIFEGKEFTSQLSIGDHYGVSATAVRNNLVFHDDGTVTYKDGVTDLRKLRKKGVGNLEDITYTYDDFTFRGYRELSKYVGVPVRFLRINVQKPEDIDVYVEQFRLENFPYVVKGERFPTIKAVAKRFGVKYSVFYKCELTSEAIEKRLNDHLSNLESRDPEELVIEFRGKEYANLMEISLAYNLDVRALLDAYRKGENLDEVTQPGLWGIESELSVIFTPDRFYELNVDINKNKDRLF